MKQFDITISGGGLIGHALALALSKTTGSIALIEPNNKPIAETRTLGLTISSERFFKQQGIWSRLAPETQPLKSIHISNKGYFGATRLIASEFGLDAFGYMIPMHRLQTTLQSQSLNNLTVFCPNTLTSFSNNDQGLQINLDTESFQTKLLVAADGQQSLIRKLHHIPTRSYDYQQIALVSNVCFSQPHHHRVYERFTDNGLIAILPNTSTRCAMVWMMKQPVFNALKTSKPHELISKIQAEFGYRLGAIKTLDPPHHFPLQLTQAKRCIAPRTVLIGNAAQTLHPVGAQGFNLGLRDVNELAHQITQATSLDDPALLTHYEQRRQRDRNRTIAFTDQLIRLFSNRFFPLSQLCQLGLLGFDLLPHLQKTLVKQMNHETV